MKNAIKKAISVLLVAVMVFGAAPLAGFVGLDLPEFNLFSTKAEAATEGYYTYSVSNGEATITSVDTSISGDVIIPSILGGYPVTAIGNLAFSDCDSLISIVIPYSITSIGNGTFNSCNSIVSIMVDSKNNAYSSDDSGVLFNKTKTMLIRYPAGNIRASYSIPGSVISIENGAFIYSNNLKSITIPNSVTSIGYDAFYRCNGLTSVIIPNSVTSIGGSAFEYCTGITDVTLSNKLTNIDGYTFRGCSSIKKIIIPSSVTSIDYCAFYDCSKLTYVYYTGTATEWAEIYIGSGNTQLTLYARIVYNYTPEEAHTHSYTSSVTTPASCTKNGILTYTCGCGDSYTESIPVSNHNAGEWITEIKATNSVPGKKVKKCVGCNIELESEIIPAKEMKASGFCGENGDNLMWTLDNNGLLKIFGNGKMTDYADKDGAPWSSYSSSIKSVEIAENVTYIGSYAFPTYYNYLSKVKISDSVTVIGQGAFENLSWLISLELENGIETIGNNAFQGCERLTTVSLPESVTRIGDGAFWSCKALESVFIPKNVNYIGYTSFADCGNLDGVKIDKNNKNYKNDSYGNILSKDGSVLFHYISNNEKYDVPADVRIIADYAFYFANIKKVSLHNEVTEIGQYAFSTTDLEYLHIPQRTTKIGKGIFFFTSAYICSDNEECYAKKYAEENNIEFRLCENNHKEHDHSYTSSITVSATCTENGILTYVCECGDSYTESIPVIGHNVGEWEIVDEATCTQSGKKIKKCTKCMSVLESEEIPAKSHVPSEWEIVLEPTTESEGRKLKKCIVCSVILEESAIAKLPKEPVKDNAIVKNPSTSTVNYGDSIVLHVDPSKVPEGGRVEWYPSNGNFSCSASADGTTCTITPNKSGDTTFTVLIYDAEGNIVSTDEQTMTSKAGFFDKIIAFFKKLFGLNKIIPEAFKSIY